MDTAGAAEELSTASEYQRKAGRRAACLGLVIIIVIAVVLVAVRHRSIHAPHDTVLTFSLDFIVVGSCDCVIIDDCSYDNLMALVHYSLMIPTNSRLTSTRQYACGLITCDRRK